MVPILDSVVSVEPVVETEDGEISSWLTNDKASPITIGEGPVVSIAYPVEEIFPSSNLIATNVLKEVVAVEAVKHLTEPQLFPSPPNALAPHGDKALSRAQHAPIAAVPLALPTVTPQCPAIPVTFLATVHSFDEAPLFVAPPPSSAAPSRRVDAPNLLAPSDQPHRRAADPGRRVFGIAFFNRLPDRRFVSNLSGKWSDLGRALLRQHLLEVPALRPPKFYQRPSPPPKPPPEPPPQQ
ncbi:hypothetical protein AAVH_38153 [Aphelenchoides avenae]|nr:hypothetical protein AAVH_38153 [Aphelenchus avenae]